MGSLHRFDSARDPLAELQTVLVWVKQKNAEKVAFLNGPPMVSIQSGVIKRSEEGKIINAARDWAKAWLAENRPDGIFNHPELGTISLSARGVKNSAAHLAADQHIQALPAVPAVLENSVLIERSLDRSGKPIENATIAAPVLIDGEHHYVVVRLRKDLRIQNNPPCFYVVAAEDVRHTQKNAALSLETRAVSDHSESSSGGKNRLLNVLHTF